MFSQERKLRTATDDNKGVLHAVSVSRNEPTAEDRSKPNEHLAADLWLRPVQSDHDCSLALSPRLRENGQSAEPTSNQQQVQKPCPVRMRKLK